MRKPRHTTNAWRLASGEAVEPERYALVTDVPVTPAMFYGDTQVVAPNGARVQLELFLTLRGVDFDSALAAAFSR